jgi:hypothetical protein
VSQAPTAAALAAKAFNAKTPGQLKPEELTDVQLEALLIANGASLADARAAVQSTKQLPNGDTKALEGADGHAEEADAADGSPENGSREDWLPLARAIVAATDLAKTLSPARLGMASSPAPHRHSFHCGQGKKHRFCVAVSCSFSEVCMGHIVSSACAPHQESK